MFEMTRCCCVSLRTGTLIIAVIDMVIDLLHLVLGVVAISNVSGQYINEGTNDDALSVALLVTEALVAIVDFSFAVVLLRGVHQESVKKVMIWWWWSTIQLAMQTVVAIIFLFYEERVWGLHIVLTVFIMTILVYSLAVVHSYARSLKRRKRLASEILMQENEDMIDI